MKDVYIICGVSGAGKTWVCKQLTDKFEYVPHDEHYSNITKAIINKAVSSNKPIITECPFGERLLRQELEKYNFKVKPYFVIEQPEVVASRYMERERKPIQKSALTRSKSIVNRADEWQSPRGTSEEVLKQLQAIQIDQTCEPCPEQ